MFRIQDFGLETVGNLLLELSDFLLLVDSLEHADGLYLHSKPTQLHISNLLLDL